MTFISGSEIILYNCFDLASGESLFRDTVNLTKLVGGSAQGLRYQFTKLRCSLSTGIKCLL